MALYVDTIVYMGILDKQEVVHMLYPVKDGGYGAILSLWDALRTLYDNLECLYHLPSSSIDYRHRFIGVFEFSGKFSCDGSDLNEPEIGNFATLAIGRVKIAENHPERWS